MVDIRDCGLMLEPQLGMPGSQVVEAAKLAERLGFGYVFRSDHLLPTNDKRGVDSPECWTTLGAVSASTARIKFGPMVSPIGFRNPALLAKMACTLHSMSGGRLQLAVGAGWYEPEYVAHGIQFPNYRARMGQLREAIAIINSLTREGRADFDGKYFSAHTDCHPRPDGKLHLIVGGWSAPTARVAASMADEWNVFVSPKEKLLRLREAFLASLRGREVLMSETGPFMIGRTADDLEKNAAAQVRKLGQPLSPSDLLKRIAERNAPCGTVDEFKAHLAAKAELGIKRFYFQTLVPENVEMLELLAEAMKQGF